MFYRIVGIIFGIQVALLQQRQNEIQIDCQKIGLKTQSLIGQPFDRINMVVIPKVGGCEAAFSRHPRT